MDKDKLFDITDETKELKNSIESVDKSINKIDKVFSENEDDINKIYKELGIAKEANFSDEKINLQLNRINNEIDKIIIPNYKGQVNISIIDSIVGILAGIVASIVDIFIVGTPEVVKIYKGGENFDGSLLTKALRSIGNEDDNLSKALHWLSDKCKVPYDISVSKNVVIPDNHRLRGFAHDPLLGILFAIADIIMGTTTTINDAGKLTVLVNDNTYPTTEKYLSVIYYFGHLLSDLCTARGLPIPGFATTQFFVDGDNKHSIARIAENMYKDGYDLRHLVSMSSAVAIKDFIINIYINLKKNNEAELVTSIACKEIQENQEEIYKYKLRMISDAVACGGNALKFFLPPTSGNWTALNIPEWAEMVFDVITNMKYEFRDKTVEKAIFNRETIDENWSKLLNN